MNPYRLVFLTRRISMKLVTALVGIASLSGTSFAYDPYAGFTNYFLVSIRNNTQSDFSLIKGNIVYGTLYPFEPIPAYIQAGLSSEFLMTESTTGWGAVVTLIYNCGGKSVNFVSRSKLNFKTRTNGVTWSVLSQSGMQARVL